MKQFGRAISSSSKIQQSVLAVTAFGSDKIISSGAATAIFPYSKKYEKEVSLPAIKIDTYSMGFGALLKLPSSRDMTMYNQRSDAMTSSENSPEGGDCSDLMQPLMPASIYFQLLAKELNSVGGRKDFPHNETSYSSSEMIGALFIGSKSRALTKEFDRFCGEMREKIGRQEVFIYDEGKLYQVRENNKIDHLAPEFFEEFISADTMHDVQQMALLKQFRKEYVTQSVSSPGSSERLLDILRAPKFGIADRILQAWFTDEAAKQGLPLPDLHQLIAAPKAQESNFVEVPQTSAISRRIEEDHPLEQLLSKRDIYADWNQNSGRD